MSTSPDARRDFFASLPEHCPRSPDRPLALQGIRVIDFSHFLAGPFATVVLADMGADVIKVEAPKGDDFRHYPPHHPGLEAQGAAFLWGNRNKRSIALDLKSVEGLRIARELVATADVLVENFSTGVMDRLGLDYVSCERSNPRLVYCSVSAYGRDGSFADRVGLDPIAQAESGFMSMNGYPDRPGVRTASSVMDLGTALMAGNAILGALFARHATGRGQRVDVALFDTALTMVGYTSMQSMFGMDMGVRIANTSPDSCPNGVFLTKDKPFYLSAGADRNFQRLCRLVGREDLMLDPRFKSRAGRTQHREELDALFAEIFAGQLWAHWQPLLREAQIPNGQVRTMEETLRSDEVRERGLVARVRHPVLGWIPNIPLPIRMSDTPLADPRCAPAIGEHTAEVLSEVLGYTEDIVQSLMQTGAVGPQAARAVQPAEPSSKSGFVPSSN